MNDAASVAMWSCFMMMGFLLGKTTTQNEIKSILKKELSAEEKIYYIKEYLKNGKNNPKKT